MRIELIDGTKYSVMRAEITGGRFEIDFYEMTAEELQKIFSVPGNISTINILTDDDNKYGIIAGWTVYGGIMLNGDIKTVILTKPVDATEKRITDTEAAIIELQTAVKTYGSDEVKASVKVAQIQAQNLTDEQALTVKDIYPVWDGNGVSYQKDYYLTYDGKLYKVLQAHTSQADWVPDAAPSLFAEVLPGQDGTGIGEWVQPDSTNPYMTGDQVTHNGATWESLIDNNVWEPGAQGTEALWQKVTE